MQGNSWHWLWNNSIPSNKFLSRFISLPVSAKVMNPDFIVECVVQVYFLDAQLIKPPPGVKIQHEVDFWSFVLLSNLHLNN